MLHTQWTVSQTDRIHQGPTGLARCPAELLTSEATSRDMQPAEGGPRGGCSCGGGGGGGWLRVWVCSSEGGKLAEDGFVTFQSPLLSDWYRAERRRFF